MIYFIVQEDKYVKIGLSERPEDRLGEFSKGNGAELKLWLTIPGEKKEEFILHNEFKDFRIKGEWFSFNAVIKDSVLKWDKQKDWPHIFKILEESQQPKLKRITISGDSKTIDEIKETAWRCKMSMSRYMINLFESQKTGRASTKPANPEKHESHKPKNEPPKILGYSKERQVGGKYDR